MDNLNEHINRFKRLTGILVEQKCVTGKCKGDNVTGKYEGEDFTYEGQFNKKGSFNNKGYYTKYTDKTKKSIKYIYKGYYNNGTPNGKGTLYHIINKFIYDGDIKINKRTGTGKIRYYDKVDKETGTGLLYTYEGSFNDGKFDGNGKITFSNGSIYEGTFKNDMFIKDGVEFSIEDLKRVESNKQKNEPLISKEITNIKDYKGDGGTLFHTDFVYNGEVKDGKIEGEGIITFNDRSTYSGEFKNNQIDGRGVFTFSDKSTYDGEFKTVKDDNGVSYDFTYYYGDKPKVIKDLVSHNKKSPIEQIKYQNINPEDNPEGVQNVSDLFNVCERLDLTIKLDGVTNFDFKIVELVNVANPTIRYKSKKTKNGQIPFLDVRYGKYNVRVKIQKKGLFEQEITINDPKIIMGVDLKSSDKKINIFNLELGRKLKTIASEYKSSGKNSIKKCEDLINSFYEFYVDVVTKNINIKQDIQNPDNILVIKDKCEECAQAYYSKFDNRTKTSTKRLSSVNQNKDYFKVNAYITEGLDIYNKTEAMDFSKSIRKVLSEHSKKNEGLVIESKIIDNRFNFVFESNKDNQYKCLNNLTEERNKLIDFGYNNDIIREMFITYTDKVFKDIRDVK